MHPKGTGVVVTAASGVPPHELVAEYIGELYSPFRWLERQDAVAAAQREFGMPPALPDFYNIVLERPSTDAKGYGLWSVSPGILQACRVSAVCASRLHLMRVESMPPQTAPS